MNDGPLNPLCDDCSTNGEPFYCWLSAGGDASDSVRHHPRGTVLFAQGQAPRFIRLLPFVFQTPEVRLSFRLGRRADWNVGYQYYAYKEKPPFNTGQDYRAHLPYTSLRVYFFSYVREQTRWRPMTFIMPRSGSS